MNSLNKNYEYLYKKYKNKYLRLKEEIELMGGTKRGRNWTRGEKLDEETRWSRSRKIESDDRDWRKKVKIEDEEEKKESIKTLKRENTDPLDFYNDFYNKVKGCIRNKIRDKELKDYPKVTIKEDNIYIKFEEETYHVKNHVSIHKDNYTSNRFHFYLNNEKTDLKIVRDTDGKLNIEKREGLPNLRITNPGLKITIDLIKECYNDQTD